MTTRLSISPVRRLLACIIGQTSKTQICPDMPLLSGRLALITGTTSGIGKETARGLLLRGADVVMLCRNGDKAEVVKQEFIAHGLDARLMHIIRCDLADMESVEAAIADLRARLSGRQIDILIENAGMMAAAYGEAANGVEIHFAGNVLGHFALRQGLMSGILSPHARIIILTDDQYLKAHACTPQFKWRGRQGALKAYNRSKLGNFWMARELQRRHPQLNVYIVHPGLVATGLDKAAGFWARQWRRNLFIDATLGAQTSLLCATQEDLSHGSYYHNVLGEAEPGNADPATNDIAAARLWEICLQLTETRDKIDNRISFAS